MKFKAETRDGRPVRIYATDGSGEWPIHGAIKHEDGWQSETWLSSGRVVSDDGGPHDDDLLPIREPSEAAMTAAKAAWSNSSAKTFRDTITEALRAAYEIDGIGGGE